MTRPGPTATGRTPLPVPLGPAAAGHPTRFPAAPPVEEAVLTRLRGVCEVSSDAATRVEAGRDWWPLAVTWAVEGRAPAFPAAVARPRHAGEVAAVLAVCHDAQVAVTPFAGLSGVCGGAVPIHGGISLDLTALEGIVGVDQESLTVDVRAGTFGDAFEEELRGGHALTAGHWPQSVALSTVGGWVACRGAGQYSTRYGKIEDMVVGLEVALADGRIIRTGAGAPRSATGPDLTQLFVGSEGTLGVVTEVRLRVHPLPAAERRAAYGFPTFAEGLDACRRVLRRGATPAVLRLYDRVESARTFDSGDVAVLVVVDEGDPAIIDTAMAIVAEESEPATTLDAGVAGRWLERRNHIPAVADLVSAGLVVDTVEIAGSWRALPAIYEAAVARVAALPGTIAVSAHQSHAYIDGACLYFTFAGQPGGAAGTGGDGDMGGDGAEAESYYRRAFDAITEAALESGGTISHHHGIGINRARYMRQQLGGAFPVLTAVKDALDPRGILNPGKLGLDSPFGALDIP